MGLRSFRIWRRLFPALTTGGLVALMVGCGNMNQAPLAPQPTGPVQTISTRQTATGFSISLQGPGQNGIRAAKPADGSTDTGLYSATASGKFTVRRGGHLDVRLPDYSNDGGPGRGKQADQNSTVQVRVDQAKFFVKNNSLDQDREISMTVYSGSTLADISVVFSPSGTVFNPPARLELYLVGNLDPNTVIAYHIHGQKVVSKVTPDIDPQGRLRWKISLDIPGFSTYSLGGDNGIPAPEVTGP